MPQALSHGASRAAATAALERARHFFVDWDGCLVERGVLRRGAYRFLRRFAPSVSILSNNSTDTPERLSAFLARQGVTLTPAQFFLAGDVTLRLVAARAGARPVYLVANDAMREHARSLGLRQRRRSAHAVVLLRDTTFSFEKLERAANLLRAGAALVVANPDVTHPRGAAISPETGALLAALASCVDLRRVEMSIVGKPEAPLFERALAAAGREPDDVVMIGDSPATDIAGAARLGIPSVLIGDAAVMTLDDIVESLLRQPAAAAPDRRTSPVVKTTARRFKTA